VFGRDRKFEKGLARIWIQIVYSLSRWTLRVITKQTYSLNIENQTHIIIIIEPIRLSINFIKNPIIIFRIIQA
jgi:hypothetical protein